MEDCQIDEREEWVIVMKRVFDDDSLTALIVRTESRL